MPRERREILSSLQAKGFSLEQGKRDHDVLRLRLNGRLTGIFTRVSRGTSFRDYSDNLLSKMSKQLHLSRSELNDLIDCPLDGPAYATLLATRVTLQDLPRPRQ